jgi:putative oxidoreductase
MGMMQRLNRTAAPAAVLLIRILVGWVFVAEGIQKFIFSDAVGVGRFAKIGIPAPHVMAPFVGVVEIVCGAMVLTGLLTCVAVIPLLISMTVAVISTKVPILLGHSLGPFAAPKALPYGGLWGMLHEARTDFSMILGLLFLLMVGAGKWSLDARLFGTDRR